MTDRKHQWLIGSCWGRPAYPPLPQEHYWVRTLAIWTSLCRDHTLPAAHEFEGVPSIDLYFEDDPAKAHRCTECLEIYLSSDYGSAGVQPPSR